ncbi:MAG: 4-hydroxythreonine-4-phosphate dehydrogenase PdxA [Burkholderiales bacterium]
MMSARPTVALFTGDPAGIGPELVARLLADPATTAAAHILLIGAQSVVAEGMRAAGVTVGYERGPAVRGAAGIRLVEWPHADATGFAHAEVAAGNGAYMLAGLKLGLDLCQRGIADAMCFAPLNKAALRAGGMRHADELHYFCEVLNFTGPAVEFNVLESLWTSRVTSHVPLKDVSGLLTRDGIAEGIALLTRGLRASGVGAPRIAVCGLNPHNGDNGAFGREEMDVIEPGVALARERGFPADGPFPADTIFVRATRKEGAGYDGVLTMYHDQGQIAMKLMGFDRGVTVPGGLPIPIATPAHGTAYDIAGKGLANAGAMRNAFALACRMGATRLQQRAAAQS